MYKIRIDSNRAKYTVPATLLRETTESKVPAIKFLGIFIDPLRNFKFQINSIVSKVSKSIVIINNRSQQKVSKVYFLIGSVDM